ncbi:hypothetical protein PspLS_04079 [Pyricularia sp. CBS 133598]|nr:hypothetical protein PspLS_04079 [Pyricularia sp. CBS 133598]
MASAASKIGVASVMLPLTAAGAAYMGRGLARVDWQRALVDFFTGPGRTSRILLLVFVAANRKNMLFVWTARVWGAVFRHVLAPRDPLPMGALFHYTISQSHAPLLETDYNMHKSNSTYFTDLDIARTHLVMHLLANGMRKIRRGDIVIRDKQGEEVPGTLTTAFGSVFCSWKREILPYKGYEIWTRVLSWDRKWLYMVSYFVEKGKVLPTGFDMGSKLGASGKVRNKATGAVADDSSEDFQKYVYATSIGKYVCKKGRFTVHPAIVLEASGLLPERPGEGWRGGEDSETGTPDDLSDVDETYAEWDWRKVERKRRQGHVFAEHFAALDGLQAEFDGGKHDALGRFGPA